MPELRILHFIPNLSKGGAERLVIDICNELNNRSGVKVKLVILEDKNEFQILSKNIDIEICPTKISLSVLNKSHIEIANFKKIVSEFKPDIIHSHLFIAEIVSRWEIYPGIKYFTHCHDNMAQFKKLSLEKASKERITNYFEKNLLLKRYKKCDNNFIAISKNTETYFQKNIPKSFHKKIHLLPNAINYELFSVNASQKTIGNICKLITIGSLVDKKNQIFLLDVVHYLKDKGYQVELDLGLTEQVTLRGNVNNVEDFLKQSDIYLHSATYEPFGLVLLEAMASGVPVVCLDGKGNRDIIEEGVNGFMILENNVETFSNKIIELIVKPELYNHISKNSKVFSKDYDIKNYVNKLLLLYRN